MFLLSECNKYIVVTEDINYSEMFRSPPVKSSCRAGVIGMKGRRGGDWRSESAVIIIGSPIAGGDWRKTI